MHNLNRKGEIALPCPTPVLPVCSVMRTIWYITHLYGKMAFVKALLYLCRSYMEIQHALCHLMWQFWAYRPLSHIFVCMIHVLNGDIMLKHLQKFNINFLHMKRQ